MIGMATGRRIINRTTEIIKRRNRISLPFHPKDLNFKASKGMSETIRNERPSAEPIKNHRSTITCSGSHHRWNGMCSIIRGIEITHIALAGVGTPRKLSDCRVSTLNFANRKAEKIGTNNGINNNGCSKKVERPSMIQPVVSCK